MSLRGSVDLVTSTEVIGWAYAPGRAEPVVVQAMLHHEVLGEATANIHRPDLAAIGMGTGKCGYGIALHRPIDPLYLPFVSVKLDGGDAELPRANASGFGEFFAALYRTRPAPARTRSVFGGLWTDRLDAPAVLRGKAGLGVIPAPAASAIARLIQEGVTVIGSVESADPLDDPALLQVLRGVLEDNPLVVKSEPLGPGDAGLTQPSLESPAPSPAECLAVVIPGSADAVVELVRESQSLPEFTPSGASRWADSGARGTLEALVRHSVIDRIALPVGSVGVVAPGAIHRVRSSARAGATRLLCLPARLVPANLALDGTRQEAVRASGVRMLL